MKTATFLSLLTLAAAAPAIKKRAEPAPIIVPRVGSEIRALVPHSYIVKLKEGVNEAALDAAISQLSEEATHVYKAGTFKGFASKMDATTLETIQNIEEVRTHIRMITA
jgi:hypothetical protein